MFLEQAGETFDCRLAEDERIRSAPRRVRRSEHSSKVFVDKAHANRCPRSAPWHTIDLHLQRLKIVVAFRVAELKIVTGDRCKDFHHQVSRVPAELVV